MPRKSQSAKPDPSTSANAAPDAAQALAGVSFEHAIGELEDIVEQMENGDASLQESLAAYQRGAALVAHCRRSLDDVAQQVKVLEGGLLKPLKSDADPDAAETDGDAV